MSNSEKKSIELMSEQNVKHMFLTRRSFMKGTLVAGSALAIAGCGSKTTQAPEKKEAKEAPKKEDGAKKMDSPHYLAIDYEKCVGCHICETTCAMHHNDGVPDIYTSNIKVYYFNPPVHIPSVCAHCNDAPCVAACPEKVGALTRDETTGAVLLDKEKCIGCWKCIEACDKDRTGVIRKSKDETHVVGICDLCGGDPQCVKACPENCIQLVPPYVDGKYWANKPEEIAKGVAKLLYNGYDKEVL